MKSIFAIAAVSLLATTAQAQGLYGSVGLGMSTFDLDCAGTTSCDKSSNSLRAALGWRVNDQVAVEALYLGFGKAKASMVDPGLGTVQAALDVSMFGVAGVYTLPLGQNFSLSGRLGGAQVKAKLSGSALGMQVDAGSDSAFQVFGGLGLGYAIHQNLRVEAHFDTTKFESSGDSANVSAFNVGLRWNF